VDDEKEVVKEGRAGILPKPFKIADLKSAIFHVTHPRRTERGL
jgi:hypothetical protein